MAYAKSFFRMIVSTILRRKNSLYAPDICQLQHNHEESGNYVYAISIRETEKIVHGLNLAGMAWVGINDHYVKGCEFEPAVAGNVTYEEVKNAINNKNMLCVSSPKSSSYEMAAVVIFKKSISNSLRNEMTGLGYTFNQKVNNPHTGDTF